MSPLAPLLGGCWALAVLGAAARRRPPPARVRRLVARCRAAGGAGRPDPLAAVGRPVLRALARAGRPTAAAARTAGLTTLAVLAAVVVAPPLAALAAGAAWALPRHRRREAERRRARRVEAALPDTVDLLVLAVGAGCNVPLALAAVARRATGPLADEVRRVSAEVARGRRLADALDDLPGRAGEAVRPLAGLLAGCERYGTPVLPALLRLGDEVRLQRQRRAEAAARRVPVTLLFPLVLCILPAFALLTVAPLIAGALRALRL